MANAAGVHNILGSVNDQSSPLSLTTGNVGFAQNYEVTNLMPSGTGTFYAKTSGDSLWASVEPGESVAVRITDGDTLHVAAASPFFRYRSMIQGAPADPETPWKIRVSAGAMS